MEIFRQNFFLLLKKKKKFKTFCGPKLAFLNSKSAILLNGTERLFAGFPKPCPLCVMQYWSEQIAVALEAAPLCLQSAPLATSPCSGGGETSLDGVWLPCSCTVCKHLLKHISSQYHKATKRGWGAAICVSHITSASPCCFKDHSVSQITAALWLCCEKSLLAQAAALYTCLMTTMAVQSVTVVQKNIYSLGWVIKHWNTLTPRSRRRSSAFNVHVYLF